MKCQHYLTSVCFAFLGLFVGSFIINQNSASAVSDSVVIFNASNASSAFATNICNSNCSSFNFIYIQYLFSSYDISPNGMIQIGLSTSTAVSSRPFASKADLFELSHSTSYANFYITNYSDWPSGWEVKVTFSENNPFSSVPSGSLSITANGTYDVTNYAEAVVNVPNTETIIQGDYHDDLVSINNSIMVCAGVCLVLYFFYCIYRMFIKTGGK